MKIFILPGVIGNELELRPFVVATDTLEEAVEIAEKELGRKLSGQQREGFEMELRSGNQFSFQIS